MCPVMKQRTAGGVWGQESRQWRPEAQDPGKMWSWLGSPRLLSWRDFGYVVLSPVLRLNTLGAVRVTQVRDGEA